MPRNALAPPTVRSATGRPPRKQKLSRLFGGVWPVLLFVVGWPSLAAPLVLFVEPAGLKVPALTDRNTWLLSAAGAAAGVMVIFLATLYGIARSKSNRVYLDVQQAFAELKTVQKRWAELPKKSCKAKTAVRAALCGDCRPARPGLCQCRSQGGQTVTDATVRKQRERGSGPEVSRPLERNRRPAR